jgi:hypothetical protein
MADLKENARLADMDGPPSFWALPAPPHALGFYRVRWTKKHPTPNENLV